MSFLTKIVKERTLFESSGHDFYHALRVVNLCNSLANEDVDGDVLIAAALLHDIARGEEHSLNKKSDYHIEQGAKIAEEILSKINFPKHKIAKVKTCIAQHEDEGSEIIESQILQDCDRLDAMGAIGIARCFAYGGRIDRPIWCPTKTEEIWVPGVKNSSSIAHLHAKIVHLSQKMNTERGRKIAKDRLEFVTTFVDRFNAEMGAMVGGSYV